MSPCTFRRPKNRAEIVWVLQFIRYNKEWRQSKKILQRGVCMRCNQGDYPLVYRVTAQIVQFFGVYLLNGDPLFLCFCNQCTNAPRMCTPCDIQTVDRTAATQRFRNRIPARDHIFPTAALLFLAHIHLSLLPMLKSNIPKSFGLPSFPIGRSRKRLAVLFRTVLSSPFFIYRRTTPLYVPLRFQV